jgi:ESS family glutamate:Na+ symporter
MPTATWSLDMMQTLALAGVVLFAGYGIKRLVPPLTRYNIPAPVVGGLLVSLAVWAIRTADPTLLKFDTTLQAPLQIAFFTTVGFGASLSLLRVGGPLVAVFFLLATVMAIAQNVLGVLLAYPLGQHPLMGVLAGSVTLTGGPATGLAFAPMFEEAGVTGASTVAVAAAMVGIVSGGLIGGPIGTWLIRRDRLATPKAVAEPFDAPLAAQVVEAQLPEPVAATPAGEDAEAYGLLKAFVIILVAMWIGGKVSAWIQTHVWLPQVTVFGSTLFGQYLNLPAYIGAMLVAAVIRNVDDVTRVFGLSQRTLDDLGNVALSLFLVMALMTLRLWEIVNLALPLTIMLVAQVVMIAVVCLWPVYRIMGRDYDSAVMSSGFAGFMLGTTANSMANMEALVERFGPSPKAFLIVPMVGAFFIDFTNAIIITVFANLLK